MLRKISSDGVGYSVAELSDVRHVFATALPARGTTFEQQTENALQTIRSVIDEEGSRGSIIHQSVFLADAGEIENCRRMMRDFYGAEFPATTYIPQRPCGGKLIAIEALGVGRGERAVQIQRISEQLVIARHNGIAWIHGAQIVPKTASCDVYERATSAFEEMHSLLNQVNVRFDQLIRTWLYLGDIVGGESAPRYRALNQARSDCYRGVSFLADRLPPGQHPNVYPASTGIGTDDQDVMLSCIALMTDRRDIVAVPLENPRQTPAFDYAACYSPKSPKFSRAMAISCGSYATIFISGTASITQSETQHAGDVEAQTHETLDNIEALISEDNLRRRGLPGLGALLDHLGLVRVYIKRHEDYARVRAVCETRLGELPIIYVHADVCRPELLVEIEGIAFSHRD
jgi:enamine deaminase RidA (YjgF/YER057c/UK114 family)